MIRLIVYFVGVLAAAWGLSWMADRPGTLVMHWQGYEISTSVFRAVVILALLVGLIMLAWSIIRQLFTSPVTVGHYFRRRRQKRGIEALSNGLIAVGAGDRALAQRYTQLARKSLPNEPLTQLLRAQTAQLLGDRTTSRRIYESMRNNPDTELLGLRGLYLEAKAQHADEAARQYAERAAELNPKLGWSVESVFEIQCREQNWEGALETLTVARKNGHIEKAIADRRRAVLLAAQAMKAEDTDMTRALALSLESHGLAPDLVPPAAIAGRILASQGATPKAAKIIERTWKQLPHPDLATVYAYARIGDSPRDRLARVKDLARMTPQSDEGPMAVANAAIEAQAWDEARRALQHLVDDHPSQRVCALMARIEGGQHGDTGKVREWLARAVHAPRDPVWVAEGHASTKWAPISPVSGEFDAYKWQVPPDSGEAQSKDLLIEQLLPIVAAARRDEPPTITIAAAEPSAGEAREAKTISEAKSIESAKTTAKDADPVTITAEPVTTVRRPASDAKPATEAAPIPETKAAPPAVDATTAPATPAAASAPVKAADIAKVEPAKTVSPVAASTSPSSTDTAAPSRTIDLAAARSKPAQRTAPEPNIFVPPRAPDDPGPDGLEGDDPRSPLARFRMPSTSKGNP